MNHIYCLLNFFLILLDLVHSLINLILLQLHLKLNVSHCILIESFHFKQEFLLLQSDLIFSLCLVLLELYLHSLDISPPVLNLWILMDKLINQVLSILKSSFIEDLQILHKVRHEFTIHLWTVLLIIFIGVIKDYFVILSLSLSLTLLFHFLLLFLLNEIWQDVYFSVLRFFLVLFSSHHPMVETRHIVSFSWLRFLDMTDSWNPLLVLNFSTREHCVSLHLVSLVVVVVLIAHRVVHQAFIPISVGVHIRTLHFVVKTL